MEFNEELSATPLGSVGGGVCACPQVTSRWPDYPRLLLRVTSSRSIGI